jgi:hypothetical protein
MCACAAAYSSHTRRTQLKDRLNTGPDLGEYCTDASSSIIRIVFTVKYLPLLSINVFFLYCRRLHFWVCREAGVGGLPGQTQAGTGYSFLLFLFSPVTVAGDAG